jgi:hypothetical protein
MQAVLTLIKYQSAGHEVLCASDGEALSMLRRNCQIKWYCNYQDTEFFMAAGICPTIC